MLWQALGRRHSRATRIPTHRFPPSVCAYITTKEELLCQNTPEKPRLLQLGVKQTPAQDKTGNMSCKNNHASPTALCAAMWAQASFILPPCDELLQDIYLMLAPLTVLTLHGPKLVMNSASLYLATRSSPTLKSGCTCGR